MNRPLSLAICIILPLIILLLGLIASVLVAIKVIPTAFEDDIKGLLPSKFSTKLAEPGTYSLWVYQSGVLDGKVYQADSKLPSGAKIHVMDRRSGDFIPLNTINMVTTKSLNQQSAYLLGSFDIVRPEQEIDILSKGVEKQTVIGLSSKSLADVIKAFLTIATIFVLSLSVAIAVLVILLNRRKKQVFAKPIAEPH